MNYKEDSIQYFCYPWWVTDNSTEISRGRLIWAFLPHIDQISYRLVMEGRKAATDHQSALFRMEPLRINSSQKRNLLPVAGVPLFKGEVLIASKAKKRPAIIVSAGGEEISNNLRIGKPKWQTSPAIIVAPYYGADKGTKKSGLNTEFNKRIRKGMYPQYMLDILPIKSRNTVESFLRLDHIQPLGKHHNSIESTEHRLSAAALNIFDEWLNWLIYGDLDPDSDLYYLKNEFSKL